jgi:hypothetical protein
VANLAARVSHCVGPLVGTAGEAVAKSTARSHDRRTAVFHRSERGEPPTYVEDDAGVRNAVLFGQAAYSYFLLMNERGQGTKSLVGRHRGRLGNDCCFCFVLSCLAISKGKQKRGRNSTPYRN